MYGDFKLAVTALTPVVFREVWMVQCITSVPCRLGSRAFCSFTQRTMDGLFDSTTDMMSPLGSRSGTSVLEEPGAGGTYAVRLPPLLPSSEEEDLFSPLVPNTSSNRSSALLLLPPPLTGGDSAEATSSPPECEPLFPPLEPRVPFPVRRLPVGSPGRTEGVTRATRGATGGGTAGGAGAGVAWATG